MRRRSLMFSLLFALIGGIATYFALAGQGGGSKATEQVVVPLRSIEIGAALNPEDFTTEKVSKGAVSTDVLRNVSEVRGRYADTPLVKGEPVRRSRLVSAPPGSRLAAVIPEGRVAVSVAVSDVISTGGFIAPGDRVDVLGVVTKETKDDAQLVLQDIPVLAVSNAIAGSGRAIEDDRGANNPNARNNPKGLDTTITLAVTIQEAQRLVQVDENGRLRLALRRRAELSTAQAR